jgi:hypothetical protein
MRQAQQVADLVYRGEKEFLTCERCFGVKGNSTLESAALAQLRFRNGGILEQFWLSIYELNRAHRRLGDMPVHLDDARPEVHSGTKLGNQGGVGGREPDAQVH